MGTNFYLFSKNKKLVQKYAPYSYELTDEPDFGYEIHIAKTSCGWLPSFQAHKNGINSVKQIFDYATLDVDNVKSAYSEAGGIYPQFKYKDDINSVESKMSSSGYKCEKSSY